MKKIKRKPRKITRRMVKYFEMMGKLGKGGSRTISVSQGGFYIYFCRGGGKDVSGSKYSPQVKGGRLGKGSVMEEESGK